MMRDSSAWRPGNTDSALQPSFGWGAAPVVLICTVAPCLAQALFRLTSPSLHRCR